MNKTLLGLLVAVSTMGAAVARADSNHGGPPAPHQPMSQPPHQPMSQPLHQPMSQPPHQPMSQPPHQPMSQPPHQPMSQPPRQAPRGMNPIGHYEARPVQTWVRAVTQRVWEPGRCVGAFGPQRCLPGYSRTVVTPGHYETQTQWVWVASDRRGRELADRGPFPGRHPAVPVAPPHHGG